MFQKSLIGASCSSQRLWLNIEVVVSKKRSAHNTAYTDTHTSNIHIRIHMNAGTVWLQYHWYTIPIYKQPQFRTTDHILNTNNILLSYEVSQPISEFNTQYMLDFYISQPNLNCVLECLCVCLHVIVRRQYRTGFFTFFLLKFLSLYIITHT